MLLTYWLVIQNFFIAYQIQLLRNKIFSNDKQTLEQQIRRMICCNMITIIMNLIFNL